MWKDETEVLSVPELESQLNDGELPEPLEPPEYEELPVMHLPLYREVRAWTLSRLLKLSSHVKPSQLNPP